MSNIRFQIGVPRAGDAARDAEARASGSNDGWTRARKVALSGSAARAAEERKRTEAAGQGQGSRSIALRATGGAVVDRDTMLRHSSTPFHAAELETSSRENSVTAPDFSGTGRITSPHTVSADTVSGASATAGAGHGTQENQGSSGLLQNAAAHLQALTRSLFRRRDANS